MILDPYHKDLSDDGKFKLLRSIMFYILYLMHFIN